MNERKIKEADQTEVKVPILNIRMMTDDEWNQLAYKNHLERNGVLAHCMN